MEAEKVGSETFFALLFYQISTYLVVDSQTLCVTILELLVLKNVSGMKLRDKAVEDRQFAFSRF